MIGGRWRIEQSREGIPLVFGDGKYPHDPPRVASMLEAVLYARYETAVEVAVTLHALAPGMPSAGLEMKLKELADKLSPPTAH